MNYNNLAHPSPRKFTSAGNTGSELGNPSKPAHVKVDIKKRESSPPPIIPSMPASFNCTVEFSVASEPMHLACAPDQTPFPTGTKSVTGNSPSLKCILSEIRMDSRKVNALQPFSLVALNILGSRTKRLLSLINCQQVAILSAQTWIVLYQTLCESQSAPAFGAIGPLACF
ncbi:hypothetical protein BO99DRAFT_399354 [Aspergillus violaceofuscus CBS 115571]|uniref:Uncharacterized protein n=2 Tax=Aspergillus TaxID=5052 RepID=A0A2V5HF42_ASPV1|nr:hypothetical protein BO99DRAFT_399354 [Aspergillus violaceofuscus CBS 115571]